MQSHTLPVLGFPVRSVVKEIVVSGRSKFMSDFWQTASEAYRELQACTPEDMLQDELVISYRKTGPNTVSIRVSINSMN